MKQDEIEIKLDLSNEVNYRKILDFLSPNSVPVRQKNYFFDTENRSLAAVGWALRIRKEESKITVTAKGPKKTEQENLAIREEIEEKINVHQTDMFTANGIDSNDLPTRIAKIIANICPGRKLKKILSFGNYRTMIKYKANEIPLDIAIDRTEYSDGSVDFELEVELSTKSKYKAVMDIIDSVFDKAGIPLVLQAESKYARALKRMQPAVEKSK